MKICMRIICMKELYINYNIIFLHNFSIQNLLRFIWKSPDELVLMGFGTISRVFPTKGPYISNSSEPLPRVTQSCGVWVWLLSLLQVILSSPTTFPFCKTLSLMLSCVSWPFLFPFLRFIAPLRGALVRRMTRLKVPWN